MMAGGLHGLDMIKILRNNDNLKKKNYFKKGTHRNGSQEQLKTEPISEELSKSLQDQVRESNRLERRKAVSAITIAVTITIIVVTLLFYFLRF